jgi:hypothetical protein
MPPEVRGTIGAHCDIIQAPVSELKDFVCAKQEDIMKRLGKCLGEHLVGKSFWAESSVKLMMRNS